MLLNEFGVDVGETDHSRKIYREMLMAIADVGRGQVTTSLTTKSTATGRLPHAGVSGDIVTDLAGRQFQISMLRVNYRGTPATMFGELTPLSCLADAHGQGNEANGLSCFYEFVDEVEKFGVRLFRKATPVEVAAGEGGESGDISIFVGGTKHGGQWRSTACDGESTDNGNGAEKSVEARVRGNHGIGDKGHGYIHEHAHSKELLIVDARTQETYVNDVTHPTTKAVYTHYSRSTNKPRRLLRETGIPLLVF